MRSRAASLALRAGLALGLGLVVEARASAQAKPGPAPLREIAVTFDDLPAVSVARGDPPSLAEFTDRLLANFTTSQVPVAGLVNEGKLTGPGEDWEQALGRPRTGAPDPPSWVGEAYEKGRR